MCSKEQINKIDSGEYELVSKKINRLKTWLPFGVVIVAIFTSGAWSTVVKINSFDNPKQKDAVLEFVKEGHPITEVEADNLDEHTKNNGLHMTFEEKKRLFIMEERQATIIENQKKLGQDLAEIKNLVRNNNNK